MKHDLHQTSPPAIAVAPLETLISISTSIAGGLADNAAFGAVLA